MIITVILSEWTGRVSKVRMEDLKEMAALPANATPLGVSSGQPVFSTEQLFGGASEIAIVHQGLTYRLRITRQGKLVLNK